ncbi:MAG: efflux RND transporter periplasmic adaptor subunit [Mesorhizobium sp.]
MAQLPPEILPRHSSLKGIVALLVLIAAGSAAAVWLTRDEKAMATAPAEPPPIPVQVATARKEDVPVYLSGLGTVQAFNTVTIRARVDGELQQVLFAEGQTVKKGDLLAVIDPRPFQAALDQATAKIAQDQASLKDAQLILSRDTELTAKQFTTVQATDTQRAAVEQLQAQLAADQAAQRDAATQLSYTQLTSPLDGRTGIRLVDQGNIVHATDTTGIVVITQIEPISTISTLSEDNLPAVIEALKSGPVQVTAFTSDGTVDLGQGTLSLIDNEIDQSTGSIRLKSTFPNKAQKLWPGQFVQVRLLQDVERNATTVPSTALQRGADGFFVYVVGTNDTVEARAIKPGQVASGLAIIERGLAPGERVVTAGQYRLSDGVKIVPQDSDSNSSGTAGG